MKNFYAFIMLLLGISIMVSCKDFYDPFQEFDLCNIDGDLFSGYYNEKKFSVYFSGFNFVSETKATPDTVLRGDKLTVTGFTETELVDTLSFRTEEMFSVRNHLYKAAVTIQRECELSIPTITTVYLPFYFTAEEVCFNDRLMAKHSYTFEIENLPIELVLEDSLSKKWDLQFLIKVYENQKEVSKFLYINEINIEEKIRVYHYDFMF